jgi:hypothetical protein
MDMGTATCSATPTLSASSSFLGDAGCHWHRHADRSDIHAKKRFGYRASSPAPPDPSMPSTVAGVGFEGGLRSRDRSRGPGFRSVHG